MSLTAGFACTCLLVSFLIGETSVDSFQTKKDRIFEMSSNNPFGNGSGGMIMFQVRPTLHYLLNNYPEIESACQVSDVPRGEIEIDDDVSGLKLISADTSFFSMFDFPIVAGSGSGITPDGIMISADKAKQLFGSKDVLGKMVNIRSADTSKMLTITGVFDKASEKSHMRFDAVMGRTLFEKPGDLPGGVIYVLLKDKTNPVDLMVKYNDDSLRPTLIGEGKMTYDLHPLKESYFNSSNTFSFMQKRSETFIWVGWIVCGLILFMASFNFVNLFLLSMQERKKETGIQKTLGISLWQTMRGATAEAGIYVGVSFLLSLIVAYTMVPIFNAALQADVKFSYISNLKVLGIIVCIVVALTILVIVLTTIRSRKTLPVSMMRNVSAKVRYSKLFFTVQFFVSITLCVCTITLI